MHYIVLDLEWNQCPAGKARENPNLPFEIVEIGAVKLNEERKIVDYFSEMIRPKVYRKFHYRTRELLHLDMKEFAGARSFPEVLADFWAWCGDDCRFCSWGPLDLMEDAVEQLQSEKDIPFHRAYDDTCYTARIMERMDWDRVKEFESVDYYRLPSCRQEEIHLVFSGYGKYVSRMFASREEALRDKEVLSVRCYECGARMRKLLPWFTASSRQYLSLNECPVHGLVKGKLRVKKTPNDRVFIIKTLKRIGEEEADELRLHHENVKKRRREKEAGAE